MSDVARALPIGRILRGLVGGGLATSVAPFYLNAASGRVATAVAVTLGITVFYTALHWCVSSYVTRLNRCLGAALAVLPVLLVFVFGGAVGQVSALTFVGASLLLAAMRADAGCEVMSIPAVMFGRRTHLVCLLFSPLDYVEQKIVDAVRTTGADAR
jgi:hypothetical protein